MAKTNVPTQPDNTGDSKKREQAARTKKQKSYQESLLYERTFLKKKAELNNSAEMQKRQKAIEQRRKEADEEMRIARLTIRSKEDLQKKLSSIQAKFAADTAAIQRELVSEREKNEYAAHLHAVKISRDAMKSQDIRQQAQTAAALADAQKVQTAKLRTIKQIRIAELEAQRAKLQGEDKTQETAEQIRLVTAQIGKLRREITSAERAEIKCQEESEKIAKKVRDADFARLSAKDKLKQKEKELAELQSEAAAAVSDVEFQIAVKEQDLQASGKSKTAKQKLEKDLESLRNLLGSITEEYAVSIQKLSDEIERSGGFRDQAKQASGTRVTPVMPAPAAGVTPAAPTSRVTLVAPAPGVSFPVVSDSKKENTASDTGEERSETSESVSSVDVAAQIGLVLNGLQTFETAFANYVDAVESMVTPESTEESADGVVPLDTTSAENTLKDTSATLINQLRTLVDQSVNGDIELQSQLNAKIDELNQGLNSQLSGLSTLSSSLSDNYATYVSSLVSEITDAVKSHSRSQESTDHIVPSIIVSPPVVTTNIPDKLTLDDTVVGNHISSIQQTFSAFESALTDYVNTVNSRVTPEDTEGDAANDVITLDTSSAENALKDGSSELINQLRTLVAQYLNGDIELQSQLNAKIDELNQGLSNQLSGLSILPSSLSDSYATSVSALVSEITEAVRSHVDSQESTDEGVTSIVVPPPVVNTQIPDRLTLDDTAVSNHLSLIQQTFSAFETALTDYVDTVNSMVTTEDTEGSTDPVVTLDTSDAENALRDTSSALIDQLRILVDQSVSGDLELQNHLNTKIDDLNQGLSSQLGNLSGLPESLSGGYALAVSNLVSEITGAVRSHVESHESGDSDVPSIIVPPPVVDTQIPDRLTLDDASIMGQIVLIQQTLSTFVGAFENYLNTVDSRFDSSDRAIQSAMAVRTPVAPTPVSDSAYEQLAALRATLSANTSVGDAERNALVAELNSIENRLDRGMDVDLTSVSESISRLGEDMSHRDLAKDLAEMQSSLLEDMRKGSSLNALDDTKVQSFVHGTLNKESEDKMSARLDARLANLVAIEKNKKFFSKSEDGAAYRKEVALEAAFEKMQDALDGLADLSKTIDNNINEYFRYQAEIDAKLQGTDLDYSEMLKTLTNNLGMSMLVKQHDYIEKFKELVDAGIAHNMETRAFLATVSDKVVNTFNAFDANLLRLVRIQQQDTTAARLGLESSLNKLFNSYFSDSSYLSDGGPHDSISAAILEASSMLSNDMSVEFEYMVHKWLGSLYSLGMSSDTLESIAQGLNYLGTGNVAALNSNESLQTLLAMSAARGGESYAEILVNGLDADTTNNLLQGMITYLMEIASNTDNNQVTKSAYSDLFGMHMSDLRSIVNMTETDITSLANLTTTYSQAVNETQNQLSQIINRTHMSQMVETLFDNAVLGASLDIGKNPVSYGLWKTLNIVEGLTGGIALPFINVFGSGFDLNTTVTQLAKGAMAGLSMMGNLIGALGSGGLNTGMDINEWNNTEMTTRGTGASFLSSGTASGFSSSARLDYVGSGSSGDIKKTEMSDATDTAKEDSEVTNKYSQEEQSVPEKIYEQTQLIYGALAEDDNTLLKQSVETYRLLQERLESLSMLSQINTLLGPSRVFFTAGIDDGTISASNIYQTPGIGSGATISVSDYETQLATLQKVSSVFQNVVTNSRDLTGTNVDIWSLIDSSSSLTASSMIDELKTQYSSRVEGFYNFNKYNQNTDVNTELVNKLATQIQTSTSITEQELKQFAQLQQLNKIVFPEYVRATIDDLAPGVKKYTEELLKRAVEMSLYGTDVESADPDNDMPMVKQLVLYVQQMLNDPTTILNVRESSF